MSDNINPHSGLVTQGNVAVWKGMWANILGIALTYLLLVELSSCMVSQVSVLLILNNFLLNEYVAKVDFSSWRMRLPPLLFYAMQTILNFDWWYILKATTCSFFKYGH